MYICTVACTCKNATILYNGNIHLHKNSTTWHNLWKYCNIIYIWIFGSIDFHYKSSIHWNLYHWFFMNNLQMENYLDIVFINSNRTVENMKYVDSYWKLEIRNSFGTKSLKKLLLLKVQLAFLNSLNKLKVWITSHFLYLYFYQRNKLEFNWLAIDW